MKRVFVRLGADRSQCVGCLTCELACAAEHSQSKDIQLSMMETPRPLSRIHVSAVDFGAVPLMCRHCEEPPCVDACISGAMEKDPETGVVSNIGREQKCIGCWMCVMVCPYGTVVPGHGVAIKCDLCPGREVPACVEACPNDILVYAEVEEWASERRQHTAELAALAQSEV